MSLTVESKGEYCVKSGRKATEIENFKDPDAGKSIGSSNAEGILKIPLFLCGYGPFCRHRSSVQ